MSVLIATLGGSEDVVKLGVRRMPDVDKVLLIAEKSITETSMKIAKDTLLFILETSKSSAPDEFAGMLSATGDVITDVVIVPGTESGEESAVMQLFMLPNIHTVGTVHSHPSANRTPSSEDLELFDRKGRYHIIVGAPYDTSSWTCYNNKGEPVRLEVIDYEFEEEDENW